MGIGRAHGDDWVGEDEEVGAGGFLVDCVSRCRWTLVEEGTGGCSQVSAGREAPHADVVLRDSQLRGAGADGADRPLCIAEFYGVVIGGAQTILQDESGNTVSVEPAGNILALFLHGQVYVAAARGDDDGCFGWVLGWEVGSQGGDVGLGGSLRHGSAGGPEGFGRGGLLGAEAVDGRRRDQTYQQSPKGTKVVETLHYEGTHYLVRAKKKSRTGENSNRTFVGDRFPTGASILDQLVPLLIRGMDETGSAPVSSI